MSGCLLEVIITFDGYKKKLAFFMRDYIISRVVCLDGAQTDALSVNDNDIYQSLSLSQILHQLHSSANTRTFHTALIPSPRHPFFEILSLAKGHGRLSVALAQGLVPFAIRQFVRHLKPFDTLTHFTFLFDEIWLSIRVITRHASTVATNVSAKFWVPL